MKASFKDQVDSALDGFNQFHPIPRWPAEGGECGASC